MLRACSGHAQGQWGRPAEAPHELSEDCDQAPVSGDHYTLHNSTTQQFDDLAKLVNPGGRRTTCKNRGISQTRAARRRRDATEDSGRRCKPACSLGCYLSVFGAGTSGGHPQSHTAFAVVCSLQSRVSVWHSSLLGFSLVVGRAPGAVAARRPAHPQRVSQLSRLGNTGRCLHTRYRHAPVVGVTSRVRFFHRRPLYRNVPRSRRRRTRHPRATHDATPPRRALA